MSIGDGFIGKIIVHAIGGLLGTILGIIIILGFMYLFTKFGVIPYITSHVAIPKWVFDFIDKVL